MALAIRIRNSARRAWIGGAVITAALIGNPIVQAAQLAGVPPPLPPGIDRKLQIVFANDVFSSGGYEDDFRTQQFSVSSDFFGSWVGVIDHSLLTNEDAANGTPERIDQLTGSLGYTVLRKTDSR